jgi:hypothetical protein
MVAAGLPDHVIEREMREFSEAVYSRLPRTPNCRPDGNAA